YLQILDDRISHLKEAIMKFATGWMLAFAAGMFLSAPQTTQAQEASLGLVPAKAPIVLQVNGLDKARDRMGKLLGNALPDLAPKLIKQIDDKIKELSEGRDLKSIVKDGRVYVVVTDLSSLTENSQLAILLPITGYTEFKNGFLKEDERKSLKKQDDGYDTIKVEGMEDDVCLIERKGYLTLTNSKDAAKAFAKGDDTGLGKALSKETAKTFLDQDASVYVNIKAINKEYGTKIRGFKALLELGLGAGGMGIDKKQAEMVKVLFNSFLQLLDDGEAAVVGFDFRPEGANFKLYAQFSADTDTNIFLKKLKPNSLKEIGALPGGLLMYSATNFDPTLSKTLALLMKETLADDENEEAKKTIEAAMKELSENGRQYELGASSGLSGGLGIAEYKDGAKAAASLLKMFKAMTKTTTFGNMPFKEKPAITEGAETVGDIKLTKVKFSYDFDKAVENVPEATRDATKAAMVKALGDNTTLWIGSSGNRVFSVNGSDANKVKELVESYQKGANPLEKDESFTSTRKQLPADATILIAGDSARFLQELVDMIREFAGGGGIPGLPGGGAIPELKAPKGKAAYFGVAIVLQAEQTSLDFFVPVTAIQQVRKMLAPLIEGDN
ncbi:MAG: hypothetical protein K8T89_09895, partial [Planctomycetes bacterium]|nr:hypothetical protein [Planctomycetota bacterium]